MAKRKNRKSKEETVAIDMVKYINSKPINRECMGCNKIFTFIHPVPGKLEKQRCLTYPDPASKWPKKGEKFAMMTVTVRGRDDKGKPALVEKEIPIIEKFCPVASHFEQREVVNTSSKKRSGQQKQRR